jgi:hypothetical protein
MPQLIDAALELAGNGFLVFPLAPKSKTPVQPGWRKTATANPRAIEAWWRKHPTHNIGIALQSGEVGLDLDPRSGGLETWGALVADLGDPGEPVLQQTSGRRDGGVHRVYRVAVPPGYRVAGKLGPGVDVKTLGGYLVGMGSIHPDSGQPYLGNWGTGLQSGVLPKAWTDRVFIPVTRSRDVNSEITDDQWRDVLDALEHIPPEERDTWITVGMALHSTGHGDALERWEAWSQGTTAGNYVEGACGRQWESFSDRPGGLDYRFILAEGERHGWKNPARTQNPSAQEAAALFAGAPYEPPAGAAGADGAPGPAGADRDGVGGAGDGSGGAAEVPRAGSPRPAGYLVERAGDIELNLSTRYLIKGVLPAAGFGVMYGKPGSGKTWVSMDMAFCVAAGQPWQGHRTRQQPVCIVAAENAASIKQRIAIRMRKEADSLPGELPLYVLYGGDRMVNLSEDGPLTLLIEQLLTIRPRFVIVDTLATAMVGNENDAGDMANVIRGIKKLQHALGAVNCFVLAIHHAGKDETKGARGHSSLLGAVDVELYVKGDRHHAIVGGSKSRDGPLMEEAYLNLDSEPFADDDEGDPIDFVKLRRSYPERDGQPATDGQGAADAPAAATRNPSGLNRRLVWAAFNRSCTPRPGFPEVPEGQSAVIYDDLIEASAATLTHVEGSGRASKEAKQKARAKEAVAGLVADGFLMQVGPWITAT